MVQLHCDETSEYVNRLRTLLPESCEIWKAYGISETLPDLSVFNVDKHLLDTRIANQSGGTGQAFDWSLLENSDLDKSKILLAGGLTPENAQQAALIGCAGLDFNSGVESAPGKKDKAKLAAAFAAITSYVQRDSEKV